MTGTEDEADLALIERTLSGQSSAFSELVERYETYVRRLALRHVSGSDADDVAQQVFIEVYRSLASFRRQSSFKTWMTRIALRQCYSYWRKKRRIREVTASQMTSEQSNWLEHAVAGISIERHDEVEELAQTREVLGLALGHLRAEDRMIITMALLEDRPLEEVGQVLGWSNVRVRVRIHRVKGKLKQILEQMAEKQRK